MYHIHGRKLWLFWPVTTHNIRILLERELREGNLIELPEAIHVLEELDVLLLEDMQEAFYLPAGMIHAVISFTTCSHAGVYVWAIDKYLIAQDLVNYHLSFATESIATHIPSTEFFTVPHVFLPESAGIQSIPGIPRNGILAVLPAKIAISVPRNSGGFRNGHGITKTESTGMESPECFIIVIVIFKSNTNYLIVITVN